MKKIFSSILMVAAIVACNKNVATPDVPAGEPGLITFGVSEILQTRAVSESTNTTIEASGFIVAGVTSDNVTYFNELAQKEGTSFSTAAEYYFPTGKKMNFYACHPVTNAMTVASGVVTLDYVQDNDQDLIVAMKKDVEPQNNAVEITFDHVLSQLLFTAKGMDASVDYKIRTITVKAPNGGTYKYADNTWTRGELADEAYFNGDLDVSTSVATSVDESMTFLPGEVQITVAWDCLMDGSPVASYTKSTAAVGASGAITLEQGKKNTINLFLPNADAQNIRFNVTVNPWGAASQDVTLN